MLSHKIQQIIVTGQFLFTSHYITMATKTYYEPKEEQYLGQLEQICKNSFADMSKLYREQLCFMCWHRLLATVGNESYKWYFIRFQYHLQRHFVVLVVARLVVDITIMQVPIATRRFVFIPMDLQDLSVGLLQVPNKQWGVGAASTNIMLPIPYTKVKFITLATSSMLNPSQGNISVAYHDSTLDSIRFQIRWQGLAAEYTGAWLTLGI